MNQTKQHNTTRYVDLHENGVVIHFQQPLINFVAWDDVPKLIEVLKQANSREQMRRMEASRE